MKRLAYYTMPIWMVLLAFAAECLRCGVDFSAYAADLSIERTNNMIRVFTTNNTYRCAMFQWNTNLETNGWNDYHGYWAGAGEPGAVSNISFTVTANTQRVFWRLRDCATP